MSPKSSSIVRYAAALLACLIATPVGAQEVEAETETNMPPPQIQIRRSEPVSTGLVGQRQTPEQTAPAIEPSRRIPSRLETRIQNRIQNRIDRNYRPDPDAMSSFESADSVARNPERRASPQ